MVKARLLKSFRESLAIALALGINLLPFQGIIPLAHAAGSGGINIPPSEQPQVLIILDNSQGMAGLLQATKSYPTATATTPTISSELSGAIMTGSGTVPENLYSSSPKYYETQNFTPPVQGSINGRNLYSVPCSSGALNALGQESCQDFGVSGSGSAYVDNSPSMFNAAEGAIRNIFSVPTYVNNIQFGLETYQTQSPGYNQSWVYNTWVYYMSGSGGFSFGNTKTAHSVLNPCYNPNLALRQIGWVWGRMLWCIRPLNRS